MRRQWHAWVLLQDRAWEPIASRRDLLFGLCAFRTSVGPSGSSSVTLEGIIDWASFYVAKVNICWTWIFLSPHPKQTGTLLWMCLTLCQTSFLHFSMILMTFIVPKCSSTLSDLRLLKRIQLHKVRAFLENLEHKVTIITHFVVYKVDFQGWH